LEDESGRVILKFAKELEAELVTGVVAAFHGYKTNDECMEVDCIKFPLIPRIENEKKPQSCSKLFFLSCSMETNVQTEAILSVFKECLEKVFKFFYL